MSLLSCPIDVLAIVHSYLSQYDLFCIWATGNRTYMLKMRNGGVQSQVCDWESIPTTQPIPVLFSSFCHLKSLQISHSRGASLPVLSAKDLMMLPSSIETLKLPYLLECQEPLHLAEHFSSLKHLQLPMLYSDKSTWACILPLTLMTLTIDAFLPKTLLSLLPRLTCLNIRNPGRLEVINIDYFSYLVSLTELSLEKVTIEAGSLPPSLTKLSIYEAYSSYPPQPQQWHLLPRLLKYLRLEYSLSTSVTREQVESLPPGLTTLILSLCQFTESGYSLSFPSGLNHLMINTPSSDHAFTRYNWPSELPRQLLSFQGATVPGLDDTQAASLPTGLKALSLFSNDDAAFWSATSHHRLPPKLRLLFLVDVLPTVAQVPSLTSLFIDVPEKEGAVWPDSLDALRFLSWSSKDWIVPFGWSCPKSMEHIEFYFNIPRLTLDDMEELLDRLPTYSTEDAEVLLQRSMDFFSSLPHAHKLKTLLISYGSPYSLLNEERAKRVSLASNKQLETLELIQGTKKCETDPADSGIFKHLPHSLTVLSISLSMVYLHDIQDLPPKIKIIRFLGKPIFCSQPGMTSLQIDSDFIDSLPRSVQLLALNHTYFCDAVRSAAKRRRISLVDDQYDFPDICPPELQNFQPYTERYFQTAEYFMRSAESSD